MTVQDPPQTLFQPHLYPPAASWSNQSIQKKPTVKLKINTTSLSKIRAYLYKSFDFYSQQYTTPENDKPFPTKRVYIYEHVST